jgi:hypothetical protein
MVDASSGQRKYLKERLNNLTIEQFDSPINFEPYKRWETVVKFLCVY